MALLTNINGKFSVSDAGAVTFNNAFTFPTADGDANYVLQTNGTGQIAWAVNGSGDISGSGTANKVTKFTGAKTIGNGPITFATNDSTFAGKVTTDKIFIAKGQNVAHVASSIIISQENTTKSQIRFYGADTSTAGILEFTGSSSDGSAGGVRFTINADGSSTFAGQVQVNKAKSGTGVENYDLIRLNLSGTGAVGDSSTIGWFSTSGTKTAGIEGISGLDNILYGELAFHVRRYTTDAYDEVMRINNRGNVGIGTDSPGAKLEIFGGGNTLRMDSAGNTAKTFLMRNVNTAIAEIKTDGNLDINIEDAGRTMRFLNGNIERIKINDAGNVFISTPITNAFYGLSLTYNNTNTADFTVNQASGEIKIGGVAAGYFPIFYSAGSEKMRITSAGALEIKGSSTTASAQAFITNDNSLLTIGSSISGSVVKDIQFSSPSAMMYIDGSTANVGIGNTSPNFALHVSGSNKNVQLGGSPTVTTTNEIRHIFSGAAHFIGQDSLGEANIGNNAYYNSGFKRRNAGLASNIRHNAGNIYLQTAASAAINTAITWINALTITPGGRVAIGSTTAQYGVLEIQTESAVAYSPTVFTNGANIRLKSGGTATTGTTTGISFGGGGACELYFGVEQQSSTLGHAIWQAYTGSAYQTNMRLSHDGNLTVKGDLIAYGSPSDKKLKENIKPIKSALDKAMKLQGVTFDWKKSDSELNIKEDIGFIAQDVQKVIPELVRENEDGMLSMRHQGIAPILLEAIKELKAEIEELKKHKCNCK